MPIPVIDLFAGPGGLGEGFSSLIAPDRKPAFKTKLSIEKDAHAHQTLELRAFFRAFRRGEAPDEYYGYLAGEITREKLFAGFPNAAEQARREAWLAELGADTIADEAVDARISAALGSRKKWVLIGGPPCQAYSLVGRSRLIGIGRTHMDSAVGGGQVAAAARDAKREKYEADPRHHLYRHYLRILAVHRPPLFVMENVKGLLSARVKEEQIFDRILGDLANPAAAMPEAAVEEVKYDLVPLASGGLALPGTHQPEDFVVRVEDHGVPQARHRIIIVGVRADIRGRLATLPLREKFTASEAIADLPRLRSGLSKATDTSEAWANAVREIAKAPWLKDERIPEGVRARIASGVGRVRPNLERGGDFVSYIAVPQREFTWFYDSRLNGVCNHQSRSHIRSDLHRYFFAAVFASVMGRSPLLEDFPRALLPDHRNVEAALKETKFNDRFRVQLPDRPSTTVVSHIAKDGHYYIHYDPSQCRSLTVREAARLQTFPDNYRFEGPRTEQYKQVGNAVPPLLARQIAEAVSNLLT
ncbi:MAG TPA: DNA cytosine methyltransferase [Chthoniobacterales bacterium]|nr:DNA cytosine methyltransferase [Chthoniobacterales bacterium]